MAFSVHHLLGDLVSSAALLYGSSTMSHEGDVVSRKLHFFSRTGAGDMAFVAEKPGLALHRPELGAIVQL